MPGSASRRPARKRPRKESKKGDSRRAEQVLLARRLNRQKTGRLIRQLKNVVQESDVVLSSHANKLLSLSADAWITELQTVSAGAYRQFSSDPRVALRIVTVALDDPHVEEDMRKHGQVSFPSWFAALSAAGVKILRPLLEKGF